MLLHMDVALERCNLSPRNAISLCRRLSRTHLAANLLATSIASASESMLNPFTKKKVRRLCSIIDATGMEPMGTIWMTATGSASG
jgi:hypothetical protein